MAPEKIIVLIGMMGVGKTTVGKVLAKNLGLPFVDNDDEIEARCNMAAAEVLRKSTQLFRDTEAAAIRELIEAKSPVVFSVGGGAVVRPETREVLAGRATVVWLRAPIEVLVDRVIRRPEERPMLDRDDPASAMRNIYLEREAIYQEAADVIVDVNDLSPQIAAELIEERVK